MPPMAKTVLLGFALAMFAGCGSAASARVTYADITAATNAKDTAKLKAWCDSQDYDVVRSDEKNAACQSLVRLSNGPSSDDKLAVAKDAFEKGKGSCDTVAEAWRSRSAADATDSTSKLEAYDEAMDKMGECGLWDDIFSRFVYYEAGANVSRSERALERIDKAKRPVEEGLMTYLKAHPKDAFDGEKGEKSLQNVTRWLQESKRGGGDYCKRFQPWLEASQGPTHGTWIRYFAETGCKEAVPQALPLLAASLPDDRSFGCYALGLVGGKPELAKVKVLADGDPFNVPGPDGPAYPVREECKLAANEILVRGRAVMRRSERGRRRPARAAPPAFAGAVLAEKVSSAAKARQGGQSPVLPSLQAWSASSAAFFASRGTPRPRW